MGSRITYPEAPGHKDVTEFVQNDAAEYKDDEQHAVTRRGKPSLPPSADANPNEEEKEGEMHAHDRCAKAGDR